MILSLVPDPSELDFDMEKLQKFELLKRCLLESIRLRAPGAITRGVEHTFKIKEFTIPEGDMLMLSPYWMHRNPKLFPDPESFKPVSALSVIAFSLYCYPSMCLFYRIVG